MGLSLTIIQRLVNFFPLKADMSLAIEPMEFGFQLLNFGMKIFACYFKKNKKNTAFISWCAYIYIYIMYVIFEYLKSGNSQRRVCFHHGVEARREGG